MAADGRSAVALLATHSFDALVLDLILPEISGSDVLQFVARNAPELLARTIVITTLPASRWTALDETRACAAVLRKPFSLDELQTALHSCCRASPESDLHLM
jgi:CheY-like chemotaxis protein